MLCQWLSERPMASLITFWAIMIHSNTSHLKRCLSQLTNVHLCPSKASICSQHYIHMIASIMKLQVAKKEILHLPELSHQTMQYLIPIQSNKNPNASFQLLGSYTPGPSWDKRPQSIFHSKNISLQIYESEIRRNCNARPINLIHICEVSIARFKHQFEASFKLDPSIVPLSLRLETYIPVT